MKELDTPFEPRTLIEANGRKYGFLGTRGIYTQVEPTLWMTAAISIALQRRGSLTEELVRQLRGDLAVAQEHAMTYWDEQTGGWNTYPDQDDPTAHTTYTAALALLAVLEVHEADLPWAGSQALRDRILRGTFDWLVGQWAASGNPPGWRGAADDEAPVSDGLTLQIYSELLRAETQAGYVIPDLILRAIPQHLFRLADRPLDFPSSVSRFSRVFKSHDGIKFDVNPGVNYLWHPWAVEAVVFWLKRMDRYGAPSEERTRFQRILGHLVIDLGREAHANVVSGLVPNYSAGETVIGLSRIPRPAGR